MARRGKRERIATSIYRDASGIAIIVKSGTARQEHRFPHDTAKAVLLLKRAQLLADLVETEPDAAPAGTLRRDVARYLQLAKHLAGLSEQAAHLRAWLPKLGSRPRRSITRHDILEIRGNWI